ncbi:MAG: squalene/phytoene synthase family protein [Paracoccus sp. (in: a-proteobacteria)]|uniref:squalene/phytoene synthase family protein n=1 Tax=Paracoccus sp. TaxID=267 RepID=UPI0026E0B928|nr:squalene/phytoene synthase family protein [Paracoccus sp. (in: a-proteobacteria)]MDO5613674.1 squalene/phytoene synthase family protein [Paracoccus sp. (in: a-proteobacteria)]
MTTLADLGAELRRADPDRFGASLVAPAGARGRLWTLYALHHEFARIPFSVSEPGLAEIRLQWWADQLARLGAGQRATGHPVLEAVAREWGADAGGLARLVEGHFRWCDRAPFAGADDALAMVDATAGALMVAAAGVLAPGLGAVAGQQGRGAGVAAFLRAWPALEAGGWLRDAPDMAGALRKAGRTGFAEARAARRSVPRVAAGALFAGAGAQSALAGKNLNNPPQPSDFARRFDLARLALTGRWWI